MKITFLGTGSSLGVPVIGCGCEVCLSTKSENKRDRPSILVEFDGYSILIDTSPDFRQQAIRSKITAVDAVLYTHAHADHIFGIDDLRIIVERSRRQLPIYASKITLSKLRAIFGYAFEATIWGTDITRFLPVEISDEFLLYEQKVTPVKVLHQNTEVLGYKFGKWAYLTDVSYIPPDTIEQLSGLDTLIISALRKKPHPKHIAFERIIEIINELGTGNAYLTHISHDLEHFWLEENTPANIHPAYDGLVLDL